MGTACYHELSYGTLRYCMYIYVNIKYNTVRSACVLQETRQANENFFPS